MGQHALVTWVETSAPWELEAQLLASGDPKPQARSTPGIKKAFCQVLSAYPFVAAVERNHIAQPVEHCIVHNVVILSDEGEFLPRNIWSK